ncbi:MAG: hypothetical protein ACOCUH_01705, partial [Bacteriovoracia bacterium]
AESVNSSTEEVASNFYQYLAIQMLVSEKVPYRVRELLAKSMDLILENESKEFLAQELAYFMEEEDFVSAVLDVEEESWYNLAQYIDSSVFVYDNLSAQNVAQRIAEDYFKIRQRVLISAIYKRTVVEEKLSEKDRVAAWKFLEKQTEPLFSNWVKSVSQRIYPVIAEKFKVSNQIRIKRDQKFEDIMRVLEDGEALKAAALKVALEEGRYKQNKHVAMSVNQIGKMMELINNNIRFYSTKDPQFYGLYETIKRNSEIGNIVRNYMEEIHKKYEWLKGGDEELLPEEMGRLLSEAIRQVSYKYFKHFPYSESSYRNFMTSALNQAKMNSIENQPLWVIENNDGEMLQDFYIPSIDNNLYLPGVEGAQPDHINPDQVETKPLNWNEMANKQNSNPYGFTNWMDRRNAKGVDIFIRPNANHVLYEIFKVFGLSERDLKIKNKHAHIDLFTAPGTQDHLAEKIVETAYMAQPLLRQRVEEMKKVQKTIYAGGYGAMTSYQTIEAEEAVEMTALEYMAKHAYDLNNGNINYAKVGDVIEDALERAKEGMFVSEKKSWWSSATEEKSRLEMYCSIDPENYHKDDNFTNLYDHTQLIRQNLQNGMAENAEQAEKMRKLDKGVYKRVHTGQYVMRHWVEPIVIALFMAMLVLTGVGAIAGATAPIWLGVLLKGMAIANAHFLTAAIVLSVSVHRLNVHVIETPAQLKTQKRIVAADLVFNNELALSQEKAGFDSFKDIDMREKENDKQKLWAVVGVAFDVWWAGSIVKGSKIVGGWLTAKQLKKTLEVSKVKKAGSGLRHGPASLKTYRKKYGKVMGTFKKYRDEAKALKYKMPSYQPISRSELNKAAEKAMFVRIRELAKQWFKGQSKVKGLTPEMAVFKQYLQELDNNAGALWLRATQGSKTQNINKLIDKLDDIFHKLVVKKKMDYDDVIKVVLAEGKELDIPVGIVGELAKGSREFLKTGNTLEAVAQFKQNLDNMELLAQKFKLAKNIASSKEEVKFFAQLLSFKEKNQAFLRTLGTKKPPKEYLEVIMQSKASVPNYKAYGEFGKVYNNWIRLISEDMSMVKQLTMNFNQGFARSTYLKVLGDMGMDSTITWQMRLAMEKAQKIQKYIKPLDDITFMHSRVKAH